MSKIYLTHSDIEHLCLNLGPTLALLGNAPGVDLKCYPIARGGIPAAYALDANFGVEFVDNPADADFFFDDIIDSGTTMKHWCDLYPGKPFLALIDKTNPNCKYEDYWIVFPWEVSTEKSIDDHIIRIIQFAGDDPTRGGLLETPNRVAKAMQHWFKGYNESAEDILKVFEDGAENYDQMVMVKGIPIYSKCEHHMADIFGTATIAYIPNGKIVGLSKLSRLADMYARRLQVQERLTHQIAEALETHLQPKGVAVMIKARHMCMESRGICQQGHHTVTVALKGAFLNEPEARAEFMGLAK